MITSLSTPVNPFCTNFARIVRYCLNQQPNIFIKLEYEPTTNLYSLNKMITPSDHAFTFSAMPINPFCTNFCSDERAATSKQRE